MTYEKHVRMAQAVRPKIRKMARRGKVVDEAFKAVRIALFPDASPDQISAMRTMFFAGACELSALQMYGVSDGNGISDDDETLYTQIMEEIEKFHGFSVQLAFTKYGETQ